MNANDKLDSLMQEYTKFLYDEYANVLTEKEDGTKAWNNMDKAWQRFKQLKEANSQKGDLVIVCDDEGKHRFVAIFEKEWAHGVDVFANRDCDYTHECWDYYVPYTPLKGVTPVMVQFDYNKPYILKLLVENKSDIKRCARIQSIDEDDYFTSKMDCVSYKPYDKDEFLKNI